MLFDVSFNFKIWIGGFKLVEEKKKCGLYMRVSTEDQNKVAMYLSNVV